MGSDHYKWSFCLVGHVKHASPVLKCGMQCPLVLRSPLALASWRTSRLAPCLHISPPLVLSASSEVSGDSLIITFGLCTLEGVTCLTIAIQTQLTKSFAFCLNLALLKFCQVTRNNLKLGTLDVNSLVNWHKSYLEALWSSKTKGPRYSWERAVIKRLNNGHSKFYLCFLGLGGECQ